MTLPSAATVQRTILDLGSWELSPEATQEYLAAVGDALPVYQDSMIAPPLSLAARVVGLLLERLSLPAGAIHSLQDIQTLGPARLGARVSAVAEVEPPRERSGMRFLMVNFTVSNAASGRELLSGRTTVLLPADPPSE
jgi:acyl dehydratase